MRITNKDFSFFHPISETSENSHFGGFQQPKLEEYDRIDQKNFFRSSMLTHRVLGAVLGRVKKVKPPKSENPGSLWGYQKRLFRAVSWHVRVPLNSPWWEESNGTLFGIFRPTVVKLAGRVGKIFRKIADFRQFLAKKVPKTSRYPRSEARIGFYVKFWVFGYLGVECRTTLAGLAGRGGEILKINSTLDKTSRYSVTGRVINFLTTRGECPGFFTLVVFFSEFFRIGGVE